MGGPAGAMAGLTNGATNAVRKEMANNPKLAGFNNVA